MIMYDKILLALTIWLVILATMVKFNIIVFLVCFFVGATIIFAIFLPKKAFLKNK